MVKILKNSFLISEGPNQKSPLIQKIVHRVFGSRSGNIEVIRGCVQPPEADIENKKSTLYERERDVGTTIYTVFPQYYAAA